MEDDGIGEWLEVPLDGTRAYDEKRIYEKLQIFNGYGANQTLWEENNRVAKIKVTFSNGEEQTYELKDTYGLQTIDLQKKMSDVTSAKIEILDIYKGTTYNDTALTEVRFLGLIDQTPKTEKTPQPEEPQTTLSHQLDRAHPLSEAWGKTCLKFK